MSSSNQKHNAGNHDSPDESFVRFPRHTGKEQPGRPPTRNDLRQRLRARIAAHKAELERLDEEILAIEDLRGQEIQNIEDLTQQLEALDEPELIASASGAAAAVVRNYFDRFEWSDRLREQMRKVFGIENFRLAQEGVCNANLDGRDVVCIMPTGGGKSLTYQLPATLTDGCTLVISPLISLMKDQILHLQENGIKGLMMMTGSMSETEMRNARNRLLATAKDDHSSQDEIKLCYVTPERVAKDKKFLSVIKTMVAARKLARFVVDEAHCVSMQGHDYRPDYKELHNLRKFYPSVPILALSATCPAHVLRDVLAILRLRPPTDGRVAAPHSTVMFTSPLYRKNLLYKVLPKPSGAAQVVKEIASYILEFHPDETGIIYCLSRTDSERMAAQLRVESEGRIKTGVYHAVVDNKKKEELHELWRSGEVKVMCATIAFGLGIDKKDVRFVLHHSVSRSVETFYQESGRAGRDGQDADCILYYRLQDAMRLTDDRDWDRRINGMIKFCLDFKGCRKLVFANYFSSSEWAEDDTRCGHCDNCTRDPKSVIESDVTPEAKRILAVARSLFSRDIKATAAQLAQAARGHGNHAKLLQLNLGDAVKLSPLDTEVLIGHMLLEDFLKKHPEPGEHKVQVYLEPGGLSVRLDEGQSLVVHFLLPERKRHVTGEGSRKRKARAPPRPRVSNGSVTARGSEEEDTDVMLINYSEEDEWMGPGALATGSESPGRAKRRRSAAYKSPLVPAPLDDAGGLDDDEGSEDAEWKGNLRGAPAVTHRTVRSSRQKVPSPSVSEMNALGNNEVEVIDISD